MRTENRHKRPELEPACIQLAPLFQVGIFLAGLIELFKSRLLTFFHAESADVHRPIRDTADREIQSRRYLGFHIFPTRRYIALHVAVEYRCKPANPERVSKKTQRSGSTARCPS